MKSFSDQPQDTDFLRQGLVFCLKCWAECEQLIALCFSRDRRLYVELRATSNSLLVLLQIPGLVQLSKHPESGFIFADMGEIYLPFVQF